MGWLDPKCSKCERNIAAKPFNGLIISKSTGKRYKNSEEFITAKEKLTDISFFCKTCAISETNKIAELQLKLDDMIITTTTTIEGRSITEYKGIVTAQVFMGVNMFKDIFSGLRDIIGGRSKAIEGELNQAKDLLIKEIKEEALRLDANAIVGLKIDFEDIGKTSGNAFMLLGTGTAVTSTKETKQL